VTASRRPVVVPAKEAGDDVVFAFSGLGFRVWERKHWPGQDVGWAF
jgi:hypothetical protein